MFSAEGISCYILQINREHPVKRAEEEEEDDWGVRHGGVKLPQFSDEQRVFSQSSVIKPVQSRMRSTSPASQSSHPR